MSERVFVIARARAPLQNLKTVLRDIGMVPIEIEDRPGESWGAATLSAIRHATYVLLVWDTVWLSRSLLLEAGIAVGADANLVILDARTSQAGKSDIAVEAYLSVPRLHARLTDARGLSRELRALRYVKFPDASSGGKELPQIDWALEGLTRQGRTDFEQRVFRVLNSLDYRAFSGSEGFMDHGTDFEIAIPAMAAPFNVALVELQKGRGRLSEKQTRLEVSLRDRRAHFAIIVRDEAIQSRIYLSSDVAIIEVSLAQIEKSPHELSDLLRDARNRLVHGAS